MTYTIPPELKTALLGLGFKHNKGDNTYTRHFCGHFSLEVSPDMELHLICDSEGSVTGIESMGLGAWETTILNDVTVMLLCKRNAQLQSTHKNNINALLKLAGHKQNTEG